MLPCFDRLAERVHEFLHRSVESGKFVTAFPGFLNAGNGWLVYANAGHNPPALMRAELKTRSTPRFLPRTTT